MRNHPQGRSGGPTVLGMHQRQPRPSAFALLAPTQTLTAWQEWSRQRNHAKNISCDKHTLTVLADAWTWTAQTAARPQGRP